MKNFKATYIFNISAIFLITTIFVVYLIFEKTKDNIVKTNNKSNIEYINTLTNNINNHINQKIKKDFYRNLEKDINLRDEIENNLQLFITKRYKYIYLVDKKNSNSNHFRVLLDGTKDLNDRSEFGELYKPLKVDKWDKVYKTKKPIYFTHKNIVSLWITYLNPIIIDGNVEAILAVDFSIKDHTKIVKSLDELDELFELVLIFFIFVFFMIIWFSYIDMQREKAKDKANKELEDTNKQLNIKTKELKKQSKKVHNLNTTLEKRVASEVEKNMQIQQKLAHQTKLAAMGEMIGNIAHQWRQPLSVISTSASGIQLQKDLGISNDESEEKFLNAINKSTKFLSKTIDDFRDFIKGDRERKLFNLKENIDSFLNLVEASVNNYNINIVLNIDEKININGYESELVQCLLNIFNNAKDVLVDIDEEDRYIFIFGYIQDNNAVITIKDSAGGIAYDVLPKIFDPYFTTKHKSQGTGLGLHMTYQMINDGMNGTIEANNTIYEHKGTNYTGAQFVITIPME